MNHFIWISLDNDDLLKVEAELNEKVMIYDGVDDSLYEFWKTLLKYAWLEKENRKL